MKKTAQKVLKTGFGLGLLTYAEAKKVVAKVQKELDLNPEESVRLAKQLVASSKKTSEDVLGRVSHHFEKAVVASGLANKHELKVAKNILQRRVKKVVKRSVAMVKKKTSKHWTK